MIHDLHTLKNSLNSDGVIFCFTGPFTQDLLIGIGETLRQKMKLEDASTNTTLRIFSIFVEQTQNIIRYSTEREPPPGKIKQCHNKSSQAQSSHADDKELPENLALGIIVVGYHEDHYYVLAGNRLDNTTIPKVKERLDTIQQLNPTELKEYYKEQRKNTSLTDCKGAGLGFIEMARKASKPLEYSFKPIDQDAAFFTFKVII